MFKVDMQSEDLPKISLTTEHWAMFIYIFCNVNFVTAETQEIFGLSLLLISALFCSKIP